MSGSGILVVKIGGSLFDLPDLRSRLRSWLSARCESRIVAVPGGGATADVVREFDQVHSIGDEASHWLALRALTLNAEFLRLLIPEFRIVVARPEAPGWYVVNAFGFAVEDESRPDRLPHEWNATSDSVAARVAVVYGAERLVLLKSTDIPATTTPNDAARRGWVDPLFPSVLDRASPAIDVEFVNFRRAPADRPAHDKQE